MYSAAYAWAKAINYIDAQFGGYVSTWLDDAEVVELRDDVLIIYSPSDFRQESIRRTCKQYIEDALKELYKRDIKLIVWGEAELQPHRTTKSTKSILTYYPHFNFDNYITGTFNTFYMTSAYST